ncbi:hypothetical protein [Shewanella acanthi]|uniref:hypothetical protein n=1 Tax=Shewanella acanthi TaxID=2864212 RepID=UPI001C65EFBF|nr:hypothetical protein [Shewanella acanthi]QYJ78602.1 hypothetical protein K0H61_16185 [Shewanella acanthi]
MDQFNSFFTQAYWWLSLFGGLHSLGLALYIRIRFRADINQRLLAAFLALIALYFFTGMVNRDNAPIPMHLIFNLLNPIYFLVMPLLYLYCKSTLEERKTPIGFSKHFLLSLICLGFALLDIMLRFNLHIHASEFVQKFFEFRQHIDVSHWSLILPLLLLIQTASYFVALIMLLRPYKLRSTTAVNKDITTLQSLRFQWLLMLTIVMLLNWLLRVFLVVLPFYFGDSLSMLSLALPHLSLMLSFYVLAAFGLKQITHAAFIRGHLSAPSKTAPSQGDILTSEELDFIQQIQIEPKESSKKVPSKNSVKP